MVLGLRSKSRKNVAIPVDYQIHIQEIKPWVISQSHKSDMSIVFLQWEYGDQPPGSITSEAKDGKIKFTESFRLPVTLIREASKKKKGTITESYQKNILEFFLYEPRKDKPNKGQLLGTASINFADYGVIRDTVAVSAPMNCKKSAKNLGQPVIYLNIQALGNEDVEIAAFTDDEVDDDDDTSSQSSRTTTSSTTRSAKIEPETSRDRAERSFREPNRAPRPEPTSRGSSPLSKTSSLSIGSSPHYSPIRYSFNHPRSPTVESSALPYVSPDNSMPTLKKSTTHSVRSPSSSFAYPDDQKKLDGKMPADISGQTPDYIQEPKSINVVPNVASSSKYIQENHTESEVTQEDDKKVTRESENDQSRSRPYPSPSRDMWSKVRRENGWKDSLVQKEYSLDAEASRLSPDDILDDISSYSPIDLGIPRGFIKNNKLTHAKSVLVTSNASKSNGVVDKNEIVAKDIVSAASIGKGKTSEPDGKNKLLSQIEMLKEELREAAAVEVGLYSVVAEHGSSASKIHAPARRISRFYFHACKSGSKIKKENAARTAISGFILVSKACGNDVPRLTFWLSNSIMLRTIVSQTIRKPKSTGGQSIGKLLGEKFDSLDEPQKFMNALEKFESWIFSRIVESVWWQTMTPHMQPVVAKASSTKKASGRKSVFGDSEQGNLSIELWKSAFKDACQRLCPSRAGGHECGCLTVLSRLVMEQLVSRLDVAMFNAILREDGEEMPTDPVSDPISDSKVLPIPAGRSSFGAGAQLKNALGSWSRSLTDIFDIDDGSDNNNGVNNEATREAQTQPFKPFRLLNSLSDLMMIPFEMLADKSTRKEVCPSLSPTLIKLILYNFVPDEFCPTPIPEEIFAALESEEDSEADEGSVTNFPCTANPTVYSPPSGASLKGIIGDLGSHTLQRGGSSVLRKSYTSDDELDELDSPMTSIIKDNSPEKRKSDRKVVRYELLREIWKDSE